MASYKRPEHVEILEHGKFPLNRVGKTDYMLLTASGREIVEKLKAEGKWD